MIIKPIAAPVCAAARGGAIVRAGAVVPKGCVLGPDTIVGKGVHLQEFTRWVASAMSMKDLLHCQQCLRWVTSEIPTHESSYNYHSSTLPLSNGMTYDMALYAAVAG